MSLARYSILVVAVVVATLGPAWLLVVRRLDAPAQRGALLGGALALANTLAAHALVLWAARRPTNVFLGAVLGGMVGRMALMLLAVVGAVLVLGLPKLPLVVSLLSYFVLFLILELSVLHRRPGTAFSPSR